MIGIALAAAALAAQAGGRAAVSGAERLAAARAAGFTVRGGTILNECGTPTSEVAVERQDLNGDGAPELVVTDGGLCYGGDGAMFAVLRKTPKGWTPVLSVHGIMTALKTRHGGWADIEIGGPGFGKMPVARWNGTKYIY